MQGSKIKRKATRTHRRRLQANTKVVLATIPAIAQGMMIETQQHITVDRAKEREQIQRVWRWSNKCLDTITIGKRSVDSAGDLIKQVDAELQKTVKRGVPKTVGHYAIAWLMIGYLADEARRLAPERDRRAWNYLASTVNTWTQMLLAAAPDDGTDYEGEAGELADRAWQVVFGRKREMGRL